MIEVENSHVLLFVHKENNVICAISGNGLMFCSDRITLTQIHTNNRIERTKWYGYQAFYWETNTHIYIYLNTQTNIISFVTDNFKFICCCCWSFSDVVNQVGILRANAISARTFTFFFFLFLFFFSSFSLPFQRKSQANKLNHLLNSILSLDR